MYTAERYGHRASSANEAAVQKETVDEAWVDTRGNIIRRYLRRFIPFRRKD